MTCGRNPGTFRKPVFILKEKVVFSDWTNDSIDEKQAIKCIAEKLIASLGVTDPVHISHISGLKTADILPAFEELESEKKIFQLLNEKAAEDCCEVRLVSPMDTL